MQNAENYTSLVDRRLSAPDYFTDCSAQSSDHVVSLVNYSLPQQDRRITRGLASSAWCRWWRRAPRSGLGSRDLEADRRREWLSMFLLQKAICLHKLHAGKLLCMVPSEALNLNVLYILQRLVLSFSRSLRWCSREKL